MPTNLVTSPKAVQMCATLLYTDFTYENATDIDATEHALLLLLARFLKSARLLPTPLLPLRNCCSVAYFVRVTCTQLVCSHEAVRCVTHLSHLVTDRILCGHALLEFEDGLADAHAPGHGGGHAPKLVCPCARF